MRKDQKLLIVQDLEGTHLSGIFQIGSNSTVHGEAHLERRNTLLQLTSSEPFDLYSVRGRSIHGSLHDLTKISFIACIPNVGSWANERDEQRNHHGSVYSDFVVLGNRHFEPDTMAVSTARFVIDEASALFYDFDAFGMVLDPKRHIRRIANANREVTQRAVKTGSSAQILYFSGKRTVFSTKTAIGTISVNHNINFKVPDANGLLLADKVSIDIDFSTGVDFQQAIERVLTVLHYMELMIGRPQFILELSINDKPRDVCPLPLKVYWAHAPARDPLGEGRRSHPGDVLINGGIEPRAFANTMRRWLGLQNRRSIARNRFSESLSNQYHFHIDRLVGAANMFDLLAKDAKHPKKRLPKGLKVAKAQCVTILRKLPTSDETAAVLQVLGEIGRRKLRDSIADRAEIVNKALKGRLMEIDLVIREAVLCRNQFVHGTVKRVDYGVRSQHIPFFIEMLEFIFGTSELIEAGWDIAKWAGKGHGGTHPFGNFLTGYLEHLTQLKKTLAETGRVR